jgi:hypothetical protein
MNKKKKETIKSFFTPMAKTSQPKAVNRAPAVMKFTFTRQIALMCALDQAPFSIVNKTGFRLFCQMNNIDVDQFPTERHVAQAGLSDVYEYCLVEVRKILSQAPEYAALVLDCSTDKYRQRAFINYKIHYCGDDFRLHCVTLKTAEFERPHTHQRIVNDMVETLTEFGLKKDRMTIVSDNGSNIVAACRVAKVERLPCTAHNLHLLLTADLDKQESFGPAIMVLIAKVKKIIRTLVYKNQEMKKIKMLTDMSDFLTMLQSTADICKKLFII